jgi:hypothetical protein
LKLACVALKPSPSRIVYQEVLLDAEPGGEVRLIFIAFDALDGFADTYLPLRVILNIFLSHDLQSPTMIRWVNGDKRCPLGQRSR